MIPLRHTSTVLVITFCLGCLSPKSELSAQQRTKQVRLIDQTPYDQITLKEGPADKRVFKIFPLPDPNRKPIRQQEPEFRLTVRLLKSPDVRYRIAWKHIAKIELFEEMVLGTAKLLTDAKKFDEAYEYYHFLRRMSPNFPGVAEDFQACLFAEAIHWRDQQQYTQTLVRLNQLFELNPRFTNLFTTMDDVVSKLVEEHIAADRGPAARALLDRIEKQYPISKTVKAKREILRAKAAEFLTAANAANGKKQFRAAHQHVKKAIAWWPANAEAKQLQQSLHRSYPIATVGVRNSVPINTKRRDPSWDALRARRLTHRQVAELVGFNDQGAMYQLPCGTRETSGARLTLPTADWRKAGATPVDVANFFVTLAQQSHAAGRRWQRLFKGVTIEAGPSVAIQLSFSHPRPEALWSGPVTKWQDRSSLTPLTPYVIQRQADEVQFVRTPTYFAATETQPREVIERRVASAHGGVRSLLAGEIVALDRVYPWELPRFTPHQQLRLVKYAAPTVQLLVPHPDNGWLAHPEMRKALSVGIHRERILHRDLSIPVGSPLAVPLSGPFTDAAIGEASRLPSISYEPRLMLGLARVVRQRLGEKKLPAFRLAYRPTELARRACRALQQQLSIEEGGIQVELVELPHEAPLNSQPWDLLFVEWAAMEPLRDVHSLLSLAGYPRASDSPLAAALRELDRSGDIDDIKRQLIRLNSMLHTQLPVIPLWQTTDHMVHHQRLQNAHPAPVSLYQDIERWQLALEKP